jgi:hypothetical protein
MYDTHLTLEITQKELIVDLDKFEFLEKIDEDEVKEFYDYFVTTPSFHGIFQKSGENDPNLKNFIILDYLLKIIKNDSSRVYFDSCFNTTTVTYTDKLEAANESINIKINSTADWYINKGNYENILNSLNSDNIFVLIYEIEIFLHMIKTNTLHYIDIEIITNICHIVILSIEIASSSNLNQSIRKLCLILNIFDQYNSIISKYFSFIISIIYEIIISDKGLKILFEDKYIEKLKGFRINPTHSIFLKYGKKIDGCIRALNEFDIIPEKEFREIREIVCLNDHRVETEEIRAADMVSVMCGRCGEKDCLIVNSSLYFQDYSDILIHPMEILLDLLRLVVRNRSLCFYRMEDVSETFQEKLRLLILYLSIFDKI